MNVCVLPDCIHAFVLSDELDELLDSQTELETTLQRSRQTMPVSQNHGSAASQFSFSL